LLQFNPPDARYKRKKPLTTSGEDQEPSASAQFGQIISAPADPIAVFNVEVKKRTVKKIMQGKFWSLTGD
jgi:hypothetical protein